MSFSAVVSKNMFVLSLSLILGAGLASSSQAGGDDELMVRALDGGHLDALIDLGDVYGDGRVLGATTAGYYLLGRLSGDDGLTSVANDMSRALLATWAAVWVLKLSVDAKRPDGGAYSFPSGHTATSFAGATVLSKYYGRKVGVAAYTLAIATGLGRMEERRHRLADVLVGAAIGMALSYVAISPERSRFTFDRISFSSSSIGIHFRF